jgi:hypothetical protein
MWGMKYLGFSSLLLALSLTTGAQDNPFSKGVPITKLLPNKAACPDYKIIIVTPSEIFGAGPVTPASNMDPGIVLKPCTETNQLPAAPPALFENQKTSGFLKGRLLKSRRKK